MADPEHIFDPFYTTKQAGKGTGLGLSICYGIVRAHGGEILCWNNSEQRGSTFIVRVPVANDASVAAALAKEAGGGTRRHPPGWRPSWSSKASLRGLPSCARRS